MEWKKVILMIKFVIKILLKYIFFNRQLNIWESVGANSINGTDGTMFSPFITRDQEINSFSPDMCRYVTPGS